MQQSENEVLPDVSSSSEDNQEVEGGDSPVNKKRAKMLESSSDEDGDQGFNQQQEQGGLCKFVFNFLRDGFITNYIK